MRARGGPDLFKVTMFPGVKGSLDSGTWPPFAVDRSRRESTLWFTSSGLHLVSDGLLSYRINHLVVSLAGGDALDCTSELSQSTTELGNPAESIAEERMPGGETTRVLGACLRLWYRCQWLRPGFHPLGASKF